MLTHYVKVKLPGKKAIYLEQPNTSRKICRCRIESACRERETSRDDDLSLRLSGG